MNDVWGSVAEGLGAGLTFYGKGMFNQFQSQQADKSAMNMFKQQADYKAEIAQAESAARKQEALFKASLLPPQTRSYNTLHDGKLVSRTESVSFDPDSMSYTSELLGEAPVPDKMVNFNSGGGWRSGMQDATTGAIQPLMGMSAPDVSVRAEVSAPAARPKRPPIGSDPNEILPGTMGSSRSNPLPVPNPAAAAGYPDGTWLRTPSGVVVQKGS